MTTVFYVQGFDLSDGATYIVGNKFYLRCADAEKVKKTCTFQSMMVGENDIFTVQYLNKG